MLKLSKEEFEVSKAQIINKGESIEQLRDYIFKTFEKIICSYIGEEVIITYCKKSTIFPYHYEKIGFNCDIKNYMFDDLSKDDYKYIINKREIEDILININDFEKQIRMLLIDDVEIIIDIEN